MKRSIVLVALLMTGFTAAGTEQASAVVYCDLCGLSGRLRRQARRRAAHAAGCARRVTPGVGAPGVGVRPGTVVQSRWSGQPRRTALSAREGFEAGARVRLAASSRPRRTG